MGAQELGVSGAFRGLADVLETLETSKTDLTVTNATTESGNLIEQRDVSVDVAVEIPFLNDGLQGMKTADLTPNEVHLQSDGSLYLELQITAGTAGEDGEAGAKCDPGSEAEACSDYPSREREAEKQDIESKSESMSSKSSQASHPKTNAMTEKETIDEKRTEGRETESPTTPGEENDDEQESIESPTISDGDDDKSSYQDPEQLREVYEEYDTFTEMTNALGVDVTPQTVRRYMIKYDIHEPSSNTCSSSINTLLEADPDSIPLSKEDQSEDNGQQVDENPYPDVSESTNGDESKETPIRSNGEDSSGEEAIRTEDRTDEETPVNDAGEGEDIDHKSVNTDQTTDSTTGDQEYHALVEPEGVELPSHLTLDDIKEAVRDAKTLYEAQQHLEMDRSQTRNLLRELNLLDLIQTRLSNCEEQKGVVEEINHRIHNRASSEGA